MENDVKIYQKQPTKFSSPELSDILSAVNAQRANGNIEKARGIGRRLAQLAPGLQGENDELSVSLADLKPKFTAPAILYQMKVLMMFCAEAALHINLPSELLATTAVNALYEYVRKHFPEFYKNISDGAAFTFYYLAMKRGGDYTKYIGEVFAMLCSAEGDESFVQAGIAVYRKVMAIIEKEISALVFEEG